MYTADQLSKMSMEELELLVRQTKFIEVFSMKEIEKMNIGIYDKDGNLIGVKEGGEEIN